ncbi:MAG: hypothetical protein OHK0026_01350 [Rhodocyclaceae bacterium]
MKIAKTRKWPGPRNRLALDPLLAKGGPHEPRGKRAKRARQKRALAREMAGE